MSCDNYARQPFWLVWCSGNDSSWKDTPTKVHASFESAQDEANRLVTATGKIFYVLKAVDLYIPPHSQVERIHLH